MSFQQLPLRLLNPKVVEVEGRMSKGAHLLGQAVQQFDGSYRSLAEVNGCLCTVELTITFPREQETR
jgi:hypothetical protein